MEKISELNQIILCFKCHGKGYTTRDNLIDYHKREYDVEIIPCKMCDNKGRLNKYTKTIYSPLKD